jgi:hypothetical protein
MLAVLVVGAEPGEPLSGPAYVASYDGVELTNALEKLVRASDGQAFAALARDPTLADPAQFPTDAEAAYRAQRILVPWMAWTLSAGQHGSVAPALAALAVLGAVALASGAGRLLAHRDVDPRLGAVTVVLPGAVAAFGYFGPESLACGLALHGIADWERRRRGVAAALFTFAALARETLVLVPISFLAAALVRLRGRGRRDSGFAFLLLAPVTLSVWLTLVWMRIGAWPTDANTGRLEPFGLIHSLVESPSAASALNLALIVGFGAVAWSRRSDPLAAVVGAHLLLASALGPAVAESWEYSARVLLPGYAAGTVLLLTRLAERAPMRSASERTSRDESNGSPSCAPRLLGSQ